MAVVVSEPLHELVGGGDNAKYVKECTEMHLVNKGIEKIRGFELLVNLESLWLNGNKLKKLNNLDNQKRIKALYAHDNQICTLKGSLTNFKFLEMLDLSNNQLRDLDKQIRALERFKFLRELNLAGNPLCEEPDYRLIVIHRMPGLQVLDQHVITPLERRKAAGTIGGDVATLTVAFGRRVPPYDPAWDEKVPDRSVLEQDLVKEASSIRDNMRHEAYMRERGLYMHDPHPEHPRGASLPPNAGTVRAMKLWAEGQQQQQPQPQQQLRGDGGGATRSDAGRKGGGAAASSSGRAGAAGGGSELAGGGRPPSEGRSPSRKGTAESAEGYAPCDRLVLYTLRAGKDPRAATGAATGAPPGAAATTLTRPAPGTIQFEQREYEQFLEQKAAGIPGWQLGKAVVEL